MTPQWSPKGVRPPDLNRPAGTVDTAMGYVVPGANPANFLTVEEVVDMARYLLHTGDNVKLGPQILLRTMRNPMEG